MGTDVDRLQWIALDGNQSTGKRVIASCNQQHWWRRFGLQNICSLGVKAKIDIEDVFSKCFSPDVRPPGPCCLCSISLETRLKERDILELTVTERRTKEEKYALSLPMPVRPNLMTFLSRICPCRIPCSASVNYFCHSTTRPMHWGTSLIFFCRENHLQKIHLKS